MDARSLGYHVQLYVMADNAIGSFEAHAPEYNALRRKLIPPFDRFYGAAVEAISFDGNEPRRILDLGTGLLSSLIADKHPAAKFVLQDGSPAMLEQAGDVLGDKIESVVVSDFADPLPAGPFDAIVSSLAIHHLPDEGKVDVYRRAHAELSPGGWFVNAEQVLGPTDVLEREFDTWHEAEVRRLGVTDEQWAAATERFQHDIRSPVHDQMKWLTQIGFENVECLMQDYCFAVLIGRRAG
jgi:tRNA (cmo5U34)-methyltransferase